MLKPHPLGRPARHRALKKGGSHEAARYSGWRSIIGHRGDLKLPGARDCAGSPTAEEVTDWPAGSPGLQSSAARLAQRIGAATGGRINIEVFPAGALVRPFETFDAV